MYDRRCPCRLPSSIGLMNLAVDAFDGYDQVARLAHEAMLARRLVSWSSPWREYRWMAPRSAASSPQRQSPRYSVPLAATCER